ncbi:MAG: hypothetical protein D6790_02685 [Caldilineae bacterium]|nr:MAG: hypothetical protein D6790_02685 [Caldilineae bacterium]
MAAGAAILWPVSPLGVLAWTGSIGGLLWLRWGGRNGAANGPTPTYAPDLTILSFNMLHKPRDLSPLLDTLETVDPDIAVFQECIVRHIEQLEPELAPVYPYRYWLPHPETNMGFGVASRHPFAITGLWAMEAFEPYALRLTLPSIWSDTSTPWDLYVVQFISPTNEVRALGPTRLLHMREEQVRRVLAEVEARERPAVVVGDWNSTEGNRVYTMASARLVDGWREARNHPGWTWPCSLNPFLDQPIPPLLRLDYLFHTGRRFGSGLRVIDMKTIDTPLGSDHRPIVAKISAAKHTFS